MKTLKRLNYTPPLRLPVIQSLPSAHTGDEGRDDLGIYIFIIISNQIS